MLRDYYGGASLVQQLPMPNQHSKASGAGGGIIDILIVVRSDFASNLAKVETQEADAAATYDKITQKNRVTTALKQQDAKYNTGEYKSADKMLKDLIAKHMRKVYGVVLNQNGTGAELPAAEHAKLLDLANNFSACPKQDRCLCNHDAEGKGPSYSAASRAKKRRVGSAR